MIIKEPIYLTPFGEERMLHIYIPDGCSKEHPAPVLYMFDGHNLFNDEDATYGKSWGIKKYLDNHNVNLIVVGLECNHNGNERLSEFTPFDFYEDEWGYVPAKGRELIEWMTTELKDYIESNYPVKKGRKNTFIGGSSMGGTMSLYMMLKNSDIYSKGVCISPHIYPMYKELRKELGSPMKRESTVYISWGGYEYPTHHLFATVTDQNIQIIRALLKKPRVDVLPHCFKNDNHSEAAWEKELHIWMEELGFKYLK